MNSQTQRPETIEAFLSPIQGYINEGEFKNAADSLSLLLRAFSFRNDIYKFINDSLYNLPGRGLIKFIAELITTNVLPKTSPDGVVEFDSPIQIMDPTKPLEIALPESLRDKMLRDRIQKCIISLGEVPLDKYIKKED